MRISSKNLETINKDIDNIIKDWADPIEIWSMKPKELQPGWNSIMKEIHGEIQYDKLIDVPVQLTDLTPVELETNVGGDKIIGEMVLYVPLQHITGVTDDTTGEVTKVVIDINIDEDSLFILYGEYARPWRVKSLKRLPGETVVRVIKMIGGE